MIAGIVVLVYPRCYNAVMTSEQDKASDWKVYLLGVCSLIALGAFVAVPLRVDGRPWRDVALAWAFTSLFVAVSAYVGMTAVALILLPIRNEKFKAGVLVAVIMMLMFAALGISRRLCV